MKSVLLSIKPKYCELIASGKKTVEVRKNRPKLEAPFKCYIYCTKDTVIQFWKGRKYSYADDHSHNLFDCCGNGKVIGEFVCDGIISHCESSNADIAEVYGCIKREQLIDYSQGKELYGWHISNLKIYDKPKGLYEFYRKCETIRCEGCEHLKYQRVNSAEYEYDCEYLQGKIPITRPPQSWCYVEEVKE